MNQSRLWTIGAVLLIFVLLAGTWFLGVAPQLSDAREADDAREQAISLNNVHRQTLAALQEEHERMDEIFAELTETQRVIPEFPDQAKFMAQVDGIASRTGVQVVVISFSLPMAYSVPGNADPETTASATRLAEGGFYVVPFTINVTGSATGVLSFVDALQSGDRLVLAHDVALSSESGTSSLTIVGQIFGLSSDTIRVAEPTS